MLIGYTVSSECLGQIYSDNFPPPHMVIQDGVDLNKFYNFEEGAKQTVKDQLVVGWVGNSKWGVNEDGIDHKGFNSIIKPAIKELQEEGYNVFLKYADSTEPHTKLSHDEMVGFYNSIDVYLCLSDIEGTPNTVLESMASGIAVISTCVGIVPEVFGVEQKKYMLKHRTKKALKTSILSLYNNPKELEALSKENKIRISNWTWGGKCELFDMFFSNHLNKGAKTKFESILKDEDLTVADSVDSGSSDHELKSKIKRMNHQLIKLDSENKEIVKMLADVKGWYDKEYEVLPLWFKRIGHIIKIALGKR